MTRHSLQADMERHQHPLPASLIDYLADRGDIRQAGKGERLFREGDAPDGLYVLLDGKLKVYSENANGREILYSILEPGEILGEMLLDGGMRSASVKALTRVRYSVIPPDALHDLFHARPDFAEFVTRKLITRIRSLTHKTKSLMIDGVRARVIALLNEHAIPDGDVRRVPRSLTQQEIANRIGASREMVNHVVRELIQGDYIHKDAGHRMTLLKALPTEAESHRRRYLQQAGPK